MKRLVFVFLAAVCLGSCGVKGPPLPPISDTPQESDSAKYFESSSEDEEKESKKQ